MKLQQKKHANTDLKKRYKNLNYISNSFNFNVVKDCVLVKREKKDPLQKKV
jgi:hypothetical protein